MTASATVAVLVPEDEDLLEALVRTEEPLLIQLDLAANHDPGDDTDDQERWALPTPIAGGAARDAYNRLYDQLRTVLPWRIDYDRPTDRRLLGPDGYEYTPVHLVTLNRTDLEVLEAVLQACQRALVPGGGEPELAELLEELADRDHCRPVELVAPLARLLGVLTMPADDDTLTLAACLQRAGAGGDIRLTAEEATAMRRLSRRWNLLLTGGDPIAQWRWTGR